MSTPDVSIIVPIYNTEGFINQAVDSILIQSWKSLELILVNDGSTDKSGDICDDYARLDVRVRVIHQQNKGVSAARNAGLAVAEGKYIMFADSDDSLPSDSLKILMEHIQWTDYELAMGSCNVIGVNQRFNCLSAASGQYTAAAIGIEMMCEPMTGWLMSSVCGKLFVHHIIKDQNIWFNPAYANGEDGLFLLDYLSGINRIVNIDDCVYTIYRYEESERISAVSAVYYDFYEFHLIRSVKIWELAKQGLNSENEKQFYNQFMDELIICLIRAAAYGECSLGGRLFFQCFRIVNHPLVRNAIRVYKRTNPAYSKAIPLFIKMRCGLLLYLAVKLRIPGYWKNHTKSKLVKSIYRGEHID